MFSYSAGNHRGYGFVSDRYQLVCSDIPYTHVLALWELLNESASSEELVEALIDHRVAHFACAELLSAENVSMRLTARGNSAIEVDHRVEVSGDGLGRASTCERSTVYDMVMRVGESADTGIHLPMRRGIVRTNRLYWGEAASLRVPMSPVTEKIDLTQLRESQTPSREAPESSAEHAPLYTAELVLAPDLGQQPTASARRYALHFSNGDVIEVGDVTVGRHPHLDESTESLPVVLPSPRSTVSGTHARVYVAQGSDDAPQEVVVVDLESTNGTRILSQDGVTLLKQGAYRSITVGDQVDFGDGNIAELVLA